MSKMTKAEKAVAQNEKKDKRKRDEKKAKSLQMTEIFSAAGIGAGEALLEKTGMTFLDTEIGPVKLGQVLKIGGGAYLAFKSKNPKAREFGSAALVIGTYQTSKSIMADFSLGSIFGGDG